MSPTDKAQVQVYDTLRAALAATDRTVGDMYSAMRCDDAEAWGDAVKEMAAQLRAIADDLPVTAP